MKIENFHNVINKSCLFFSETQCTCIFTDRNVVRQTAPRIAHRYVCIIFICSSVVVNGEFLRMLAAAAAAARHAPASLEFGRRSNNGEWCIMTSIRYCYTTVYGRDANVTHKGGGTAAEEESRLRWSRPHTDTHTFSLFPRVK